MAADKNKNPQSDENGNSRIVVYPIPVQVTRVEGQPPTVGQILKLTHTGFLMRVEESQIFKVGENCQLSLPLQLMGRTIQSEGRVIKTYDGIETVINKELKKMRTIEVHFKNLSDENKKTLHSFLVKTGQTK